MNVAATNTPKEPARILLVDDEEEFRYAAEKILTAAGFTVTSVPDYQKALDVLASDQEIDVLVTDIVMPKGINGFALSRMARMRRLGLKIVYTTGFDVPTHEAIGKVLRKPVAAEELVREVKDALAA